MEEFVSSIFYKSVQGFRDVFSLSLIHISAAELSSSFFFHIPAVAGGAGFPFPVTNGRTSSPKRESDDRGFLRSAYRTGSAAVDHD